MTLLQILDLNMYIKIIIKDNIVRYTWNHNLNGTICKYEDITLEGGVPSDCWFPWISSNQFPATLS